MPRPCKFCGEDLGVGSPGRNIAYHLVGGCIPSRADVDTALAELETSGQAREKALQQYLSAERLREKPSMYVSGKQLLKVFLGAVLAAFCVYWFVRAIFSL